jgi:F-type H+-transporting ATPase subunit b
VAEQPGTAGGTSAHTTADGGPASFPPFDSHTFASQLVWFAITFVVFYVLVAKLLLPRVGSIIADRQKVIANDLAAAQQLRDESDAELKAYETELANARAKAQTISAETRDRLNAEAERERKSLEDSLAVKLSEAETAIAATRSAAMGNVRAIATESAAAIVQQLIGMQPDTGALQGAVDNSLRG